VVSYGKRYAVYPSECLVIAGFPIAILYQVSCPTDYECRACDTRCGIRSSMAKFCLDIIYLLVLWIIAAIVTAFIPAAA
jgi:uncharacterized membrane-anchored protein